MKRNDVIAAWVTGFFFLFFLPPLGLFLLALAVVGTWKLKAKPLTSHGSARLATFRDALAAGLLEAHGLILGRADLLDDHAERNRLLRISDYVHLATFSPTGGGKGVGVVVPNLLANDLNMVVTDIKDGENFQLTAAYRQSVFNQRIFRFDPFGTCGPGSDTINPMDFIHDERLDFYDQSRDLANMLVVRQGTEREPHWNDRAQDVIASMITFTCATAPPMYRNLVTVRKLVGSPDRFARAIKWMEQYQSHHGVLAEAAGRLKWLQERELASVLSTVSKHLDFLGSPAVGTSLCSTSFDPCMLQDQQRKATFYFCMPTSRASSLPNLYRLIIGTTLRVLTQGAPSEANPVLFLLDEAAQMGRMQALEEATTIARGKGVRLWFFFQSHEQVKTCYGDNAAIILDNIGTKQYFNITSLETAKYLSERIGDSTITVTQSQESTSVSKPHGPQYGPPQSGNISRSTSVSRSEIARKCLFPDEILTLPKDTALLVHKNMHVAPASLVKYYTDAEFADYRQMAIGQAYGQASNRLPSPAQRIHAGRQRVPNRLRLPRPLAAFGVRFAKAAAALTLLGFILMLADPKSELSQAIERATSGVATPARKPVRKPAPLLKRPYIQQAPLTPRRGDAPRGYAQPGQQPQPQQALPPAPTFSDSGKLADATVASVPTPGVDTFNENLHICTFPRLCDDPLNCPRINQRIRSPLSPREHAHGR